MEGDARSSPALPAAGCIAGIGLNKSTCIGHHLIHYQVNHRLPRSKIFA